jgi:hypothetical protein
MAQAYPKDPFTHAPAVFLSSSKDKFANVSSEPVDAPDNWTAFILTVVGELSRPSLLVATFAACIIGLAFNAQWSVCLAQWLAPRLLTLQIVYLQITPGALVELVEIYMFSLALITPVVVESCHIISNSVAGRLSAWSATWRAWSESCLLVMQAALFVSPTLSTMFNSEAPIPATITAIRFIACLCTEALRQRLKTIFWSTTSVSYLSLAARLSILNALIRPFQADVADVIASISALYIVLDTQPAGTRLSATFDELMDVPRAIIAFARVRAQKFTRSLWAIETIASIFSDAPQSPTPRIDHIVLTTLATYVTQMVRVTMTLSCKAIVHLPGLACRMVILIHDRQTTTYARFLNAAASPTTFGIVVALVVWSHVPHMQAAEHLRSAPFIPVYLAMVHAVYSQFSRRTKWIRLQLKKVERLQQQFLTLLGLYATLWFWITSDTSLWSTFNHACILGCLVSELARIRAGTPTIFLTLESDPLDDDPTSPMGEARAKEEWNATLLSIANDEFQGLAYPGDRHKDIQPSRWAGRSRTRGPSRRTINKRRFAPPLHISRATVWFFFALFLTTATTASEPRTFPLHRLAQSDRYRETGPVRRPRRPIPRARSTRSTDPLSDPPDEPPSPEQLLFRAALIDRLLAMEDPSDALPNVELLAQREARRAARSHDDPRGHCPDRPRAQQSSRKVQPRSARRAARRAASKAAEAHTTRPTFQVRIVAAPETFTIGVDSAWTVARLKHTLEAHPRHSLPPQAYSLLHLGTTLDDDSSSLGKYDIEASSSIEVRLRLRGGTNEPRTEPRKRDRSNDSTPSSSREASVATVNEHPPSPAPGYGHFEDINDDPDFDINNFDIRPPARAPEDDDESSNIDNSSRETSEPRSYYTTSTESCDGSYPPSPDEGRHKRVRGYDGQRHLTWDVEANPWHDDGVETLRGLELSAREADERAGIPPSASDFTRIFVYPCPSKLVFDIRLDWPVSRLKEIIAASTGYPAPTQLLTFNRRSLEDHLTIGSYSITRSSQVVLSHRTFQVWIEDPMSPHGPQMHAIEADNTWTVSHLKGAIRAHPELSFPGGFFLLHLGITLGDDSARLAACGIQPQSHIQIRFRLRGGAPKAGAKPGREEENRFVKLKELTRPGRDEDKVFTSDGSSRHKAIYDLYDQLLCKSDPHRAWGTASLKEYLLKGLPDASVELATATAYVEEAEQQKSRIFLAQVATLQAAARAKRDATHVVEPPVQRASAEPAEACNKCQRPIPPTQKQRKCEKCHEAFCNNCFAVKRCVECEPPRLQREQIADSCPACKKTVVKDLKCNECWQYAHKECLNAGKCFTCTGQQKSDRGKDSASAPTSPRPSQVSSAANSPPTNTRQDGDAGQTLTHAPTFDSYGTPSTFFSPPPGGAPPRPHVVWEEVRPAPEQVARNPPPAARVAATTTAAPPPPAAGRPETRDPALQQRGPGASAARSDDALSSADLREISARASTQVLGSRKPRARTPPPVPQKSQSTPPPTADARQKYVVVKRSSRNQDDDDIKTLVEFSAGNRMAGVLAGHKRIHGYADETDRAVQTEQIHALLNMPKECLRVLTCAASTRERAKCQAIQLAGATIEQTATPAHKTPSPELAKARTDRKIRNFLYRGLVRKACNVMCQVTIEALDAATAEDCLKKLHPHEALGPQHVLTSAAESFMLCEFEQVILAIKPLCRGAAAGRTGWTEELLLPIAQDKLTRVDFAAIIRDIANNNIDPAIRARLTQCRGLALPKPWKDGKPGGVRPIAIGEPLLKIAATLAVQSMSSTIKDHFAPLQFGVSVEGGAEIVSHSIRAGMQKKSITVAIDAKNAFNTPLRLKIAETLRNNPKFAPLYNLWNLCYSTTSEVHFRQDGTKYVIPSTRGTRQGDVLGGLFFALVIHPILVSTKAAFPEIDLYAYLDDITLQGEDPARMHECINFIRQGFKDIGMEFNEQKCEWFSTKVGCPIKEWTHRTDAIKILGVYHGTDHDTVKNKISAHTTERNGIFFDRLNEVRGFAFLVLLSKCGTPRMNYTIRTHCPDEARPATNWFSEKVVEAWLRFVDVEDSECSRIIAKLPTSEGGMGWTNLLEIISVAYDSSCAFATGDQSVPSQKDATAMHMEKVRKDFVAKYPEFAKHLNDAAQPGNGRFLSMCKGIVLSGGQDAHENARAACRIRMNLPRKGLVATGRTLEDSPVICPGCGRSDLQAHEINPHIAGCAVVTGRNCSSAHAIFNRGLRECARERGVIVHPREPTGYGRYSCTSCKTLVADDQLDEHIREYGCTMKEITSGHLSRPDSLMWADGRALVIDVTVTAIGRSAASTQAALNKRVNTKNHRYKAAVEADNMTSFVPFVTTPNGSMCKEAIALLKTIVLHSRKEGDSVAKLQSEIRHIIIMAYGMALNNAELQAMPHHRRYDPNPVQVACYTDLALAACMQREDEETAAFQEITTLFHEERRLMNESSDIENENQVNSRRYYSNANKTAQTPVLSDTIVSFSDYHSPPRKGAEASIFAAPLLRAAQSISAQPGRCSILLGPSAAGRPSADASAEDEQTH